MTSLTITPLREGIDTLSLNIIQMITFKDQRVDKLVLIQMSIKLIKIESISLLRNILLLVVTTYCSFTDHPFLELLDQPLCCLISKVIISLI